MKLVASRCALVLSLLSGEALAQTAPPPPGQPAPKPQAAPKSAGQPAGPAGPAAPTAPARAGSPAAPSPGAPPPSATDPTPPPAFAPPAPPADTAQPSSELELYRPSAEETAQLAPSPPPPPPPPKSPLIAALLLDVMTFPVGNIRGVGNMVRARFGNRMAGVLVGAYNGTEQFVLGFDGFRYAGIPVADAGPFKVYVLVPNLEVEVLLGGPGSAFHVGTSATGVRLAGCRILGDIGVEFSLRLPTVGVWAAGTTAGVGPAVSVGGSLSAGLVF